MGQFYGFGQGINLRTSATLLHHYSMSNQSHQPVAQNTRWDAPKTFQTCKGQREMIYMGALRLLALLAQAD